MKKNILSIQKVKLTCFIFTLFMVSITSYPLMVMAHGDEIDIKAQGNTDLIALTDIQIQALDLKTSPVVKRAIAEQLHLNGTITLLPDAQADVTVRISGQVTAITGLLGQLVTKGQILATVQSRLVGNPPPSVMVTAPIAGIVDARNINLGQAIEPNTVLFHISDRKQVIAIASVYEEDLGKIRPGQEAFIQVLSYSNKTFSGKVTLIEPLIDALTRTAKVWVTVDNTDNLLYPNMFANVSILLQQNDSAFVIPTDAIIAAGDETFVFVKQGNQFLRKIITIGNTEGHFTEVTQGLSINDMVVIQGNRELYTVWLTGNHPQPTSEER